MTGCTTSTCSRAFQYRHIRNLACWYFVPDISVWTVEPHYRWPIENADEYWGCGWLKRPPQAAGVINGIAGRWRFRALPPQKAFLRLLFSDFSGIFMHIWKVCSSHICPDITSGWFWHDQFLTRGLQMPISTDFDCTAMFTLANGTNRAHKGAEDMVHLFNPASFRWESAHAQI